jgi:hypothetical protein
MFNDLTEEDRILLALEYVVKGKDIPEPLKELLAPDVLISIKEAKHDGTISTALVA